MYNDFAYSENNLLTNINVIVSDGNIRVNQKRDYNKIKLLFSTYILSPIFLCFSILIFLFIPVTVLKINPIIYIKQTFYTCIKRIIDILGSIIGLIISCLFFWCVPLLIKLDSKGSVLYKQKRVGENRRDYSKFNAWTIDSKNGKNNDRRKIDIGGKPFTLYKLRSMRVDAEQNCGPVWSTVNDPRVTRVGKWLRKFHLDEIPQFINILKGDMSLVGPRPERPYIACKLAETIRDYRRRFITKPGLTGLAQIKNGYDVNQQHIHKKLTYDFYYINNNSLILDFKIVLLTIKGLIFSNN